MKNPDNETTPVKSCSRFRSMSWFYLIHGALLVAAIAAHLYTQWSEQPSVLTALLDHIFDLALALALTAGATGIGHAILSRFDYSFASLDRLLFSLAVGSGILATGLLICGLVGGLQWPVLIGIGLVMTAGAWNGIRGVPDLFRNGLVFVQENSHPAARGVFLLMTAMVFVQALLPVTDWDSLMYHVRVPAQFLLQGWIYLPEDNLHSSLVQLVHMLYLVPLALKSAAGPALLSAIYAVATGLAVFSFASRIFSRSIASGVLVVWWGSTAILLVAVTPRIDVTVAFYVFLVHYALLVALDAASSRMFFLAAALLGFAAGIKLTALVYALALLPLMVWISWQRPRNLPATFRRLTLFAIVALNVSAPWLFKTWLLFGTPFYPYLSAGHTDPWLTKLFPDRVPFMEASQVLAEVVSQMKGSFSLHELFWGQGPNLMEWGGPYYVSPLLAVLPLWAFFQRNRQVNWLIVPALVYAVIVLVTAPAANVRYLVPALPALTLAVVYFAYSLCVRLVPTQRVGIAFTGLMSLALLPALVPLIQWSSSPKTIGYLAGTVSSEAYLETQPLGGVTPLISRDLPSESRVLMLFEARGYYFDVPVLQDNYLMNWWFLLRTDLPLRCLASSGITHVLVNTAALNYYRHEQINQDLLRVDALNAFASRCLVPIRHGSGFVMFRVNH